MNPPPDLQVAEIFTLIWDPICTKKVQLVWKSVWAKVIPSTFVVKKEKGDVTFAHVRIAFSAST